LYHGGKQDEFGKAIIDRYGLDAFNELLSKKHETKKWTRAELQELIETYTARVAALESSQKFLV
jgi:predicted component of type VI protein secretion system